MKIKKSSAISKRPVEIDGAKDVEIRWLISKEDGAEHFAMRMFEVQPGGHTPLHTHTEEHEVFVLEGQGTLVYEGREYPFEAEHVIFVPPNKEHRFKNTGRHLLRMLCIIPTAAG